MSWSKCCKKVLPYVFSIETPEGAGSGVFFAYNGPKTLIAIATAAHVVDHAEEWKQPLKLRQHTTQKERFVPEGERAIFLDRDRDSASVVISNEGFDLPDDPMPMMSDDKYKPVGTQVGWIGYPSIARPNICFFTGVVSSFIYPGDSYLIDGVAIHGVSGGPVFASTRGEAPQLLGTVSAYMPNRIGGDALPGLLRAQDVTLFHKLIRTMSSMDEAQEKQRKEAERAVQEEREAQEVPDQPDEADQPD